MDEQTFQTHQPSPSAGILPQLKLKRYQMMALQSKQESNSHKIRLVNKHKKEKAVRAIQNKYIGCSKAIERISCWIVVQNWP